MIPKLNLESYQTLIFDCDGVILNSNKIKTKAFYDVAKVYGHKPAQALKNFHILNGGISRYEKFKYLLNDILHKEIETKEFNQLLNNYAKEVEKSLLICEVAEYIKELREKTKNSRWLVVSGGDQTELNNVFLRRDLIKYFDGGIFGSPDDKESILKNEQENFNIKGKSLFLGDSVYDYKAATAAKMDFIFLSKWTEAVDWKSMFLDKSYVDFKDLLNHCR